MPGLTPIDSPGRLANFAYRPADESVVVEKPAKVAPDFPPRKPPRPPKKTKTGGGENGRGKDSSDKWNSKKDKKENLPSKSNWDKDKRERPWQ